VETLVAELSCPAPDHGYQPGDLDRCLGDHREARCPVL